MGPRSLSESCYSAATNDLPAFASSLPVKILNVFSEYASGSFEAASSHPPATPSPRSERLPAQAPNLPHSRPVHPLASYARDPAVGRVACPIRHSVLVRPPGLFCRTCMHLSPVWLRLHIR